MLVYIIGMVLAVFTEHARVFKVGFDYIASEKSMLTTTLPSPA